MADAARAEFSRDNGNPLYSPNHTPVQLPSHLLNGDLDLKISGYHVSRSHPAGTTQEPPCGTLRREEAVQSPRPTTGLQSPQHGNGHCNSTSLEHGNTGEPVSVRLKTRECGNKKGQETQEHGRNKTTEIAVAMLDCRTAQRVNITRLRTE